MRSRLWMATIGLAAMLLAACAGEDRSGERPMPPSEVLVSVTKDGNAVTYSAHVVKSHNSSLTECGFMWGNDGFRRTAKIVPPAMDFTLTIDTLPAGSYYVSAYAKNGVGSTDSDLITFELP